ncbi:unnamed protein product [Rotaria magnacalcarata]|uniref:Peptidase S1 domain-containing protein n=2 Tax=Rotaria magnacalcarata TaxID=392030 RepID=A0A814WEE1_9BILA|nr:unnamed protein product [Rotaria magnacalcarata]CAF1653302.1 unnamed protein product [Rotaria magnacalcarata]CAF4426928.1 unnamed protein product [Rotaria magnacalcarata]
MIIYEGYNSFCGGTLIHKDYVLTATHCIDTNNASVITLIAGSHNVSATSETVSRQQRTAQAIDVHPQYDPTAYTNDIALLCVSISFIFNTYVQPACLPGGVPKPDDQVIITGWSSQYIGGPIQSTLKQAYTKVVGECDQWWQPLDNSKQIYVAD